MDKNINYTRLSKLLGAFVLVLLGAVLVFVVRARMRVELRDAQGESLPALAETTSSPVIPVVAEEVPAVPTPTPAPTPVPEPEYYTISLVGDCTLAEDKSKRGWSTAFSSVVGKNYGYPFQNTADYFRDDYMTIANLECTLTDNKYDTIEWFGFLGPAAYVNILTEGCVDFVTLANNHTLDFGSAAYSDMTKALKSVNMAFAGENEIRVFQRSDGLKVGIYCLYNEKKPTAALLESGYQRLLDAGAELTIAALHWGDEGAYTVNDTQTSMGHYAIDLGFNVVYGCHSHRLEPVEAYNGGLIFYSLGNWSFGGHTNPDDYDTAIGQFTVKKVGDELSIDSITLIPCSISSSAHNHAGHSVSDNCLNDYCPTPYEEGSADWDRVLSKLDGSFEGANYQTDYQSIVYGT